MVTPIKNNSKVKKAQQCPIMKYVQTNYKKSFLTVSIIHVKFYVIVNNITSDVSVAKILEKSEQHHH